MPLPVNPNSSESKYCFDASFLLQNTPDSGKKIVTASDKDAELIMKIWSVGQKLGKSKFSIANSSISPREFSILKSNGFITGDMSACELTGRAKKVITIMTLGEDNSFLKRRVNKSYSEILANSNKKLKTGYRVPKVASGKPVDQCRVKYGGAETVITKEDWIRMGERMKWIK